jgi:hypothetical protein
MKTRLDDIKRTARVFRCRVVGTTFAHGRTSPASPPITLRRKQDAQNTTNAFTSSANVSTGDVPPPASASTTSSVKNKPVALLLADDFASDADDIIVSVFGTSSIRIPYLG